MKSRNINDGSTVYIVFLKFIKIRRKKKCDRCFFDWHLYSFFFQTYLFIFFYIKHYIMFTKIFIKLKEILLKSYRYIKILFVDFLRRWYCHLSFCDPFSPLSYRHSASSPEGVLGLRPPHAGPDSRESPPLLQRGGPTADRTRSRPSVWNHATYQSGSRCSHSLRRGTGQLVGCYIRPQDHKLRIYTLRSKFQTIVTFVIILIVNQNFNNVFEYGILYILNHLSKTYFKLNSKYQFIPTYIFSLWSIIGPDLKNNIIFIFHLGKGIFT